MALILITYEVFIWDRFYPLTYIGNTNITFLTPNQAAVKIENNIKNRLNQTLVFDHPQGQVSINLDGITLQIDHAPMLEVFTNIHTGTFSQNLVVQIQNLFSPKNISPEISLDLKNRFDEIGQKVEKETENAELIFSEISDASPSGQIQIKEGTFGLQLNRDLMQQEIINYLLTGKYTTNLPIDSVAPKVTTEHVNQAKKVLQLTQKQAVKFKFNGSIWVLDTKQLLTLLDLTKGESLLDKDKAAVYIGKIAKEIDAQVQEGLFEFNAQTGRVSAFQPSQEGRKLDQDRTFDLISQALASEITRQINLPVAIIKPKIQTADVNNLGIKELIGRGISHFAGSIPNRIYNVNLTAKKINGVLVPPGEVFSFNKTVGDITAATGFKQAYVIKEGRTVLDDGGGVCQDSTTLFRAVLNAGLPVIKRTAHAYRVGYYEQGFPPGLDATVFYPSVDFQFKNDTSAHILIQAYTSGVTLYVDLYGTADGRHVTLSKPVVTDRIPAPPELRQDDPTLPKGTVKQVDWAAQGAKVSFNRTVTKDGETIIKETWNSNFRPWQAIYLVGTKEN